MFKKLTLMGVVAILLPMLTGAQAPPVKPLTIGDTVPDIVLTNVYNYSDSVIRLSDLRGKLVILDFWATWCSACIKEFPKMEQLRKEFDGPVQFIMVNSDKSETEKKVHDFFKRREDRTGISFTMTYVLQDSLLFSYFPHREIPHYVWANETGKIVGITDASDVTAENITSFLNKSSKVLFTKMDNRRFNRDKPLLIDENGGDNPSAFLYRSIITGYKEHFGAVAFSNRIKGSDNLVNRLYVINHDIYSLLQFAYPSVFKHHYGRRLIVEAKNLDKAKLMDPAEHEKPENRFCYEIITNPTPRDRVIKYLQEDIRRYFDIVARNEYRKTDCYILRSTPAAEKIMKTKGGEPWMDVQDNTLKKLIRNKPVSALVNSLLHPLLVLPLLDETDLDFNIDLDIPYDFQTYSFDQVQKYLEAHGLKLTSEEREIEVIVIANPED